MPLNICSSLDGYVDLFDIVFTSPRNARSEVAEGIMLIARFLSASQDICGYRISKSSDVGALCVLYRSEMRRPRRSKMGSFICPARRRGSPITSMSSQPFRAPSMTTRRTRPRRRWLGLTRSSPKLHSSPSAEWILREGCTSRGCHSKLSQLRCARRPRRSRIGFGNLSQPRTK